MDLHFFPNTIVTNLSDSDSSCFESFSIVPNYDNEDIPYLRVVFKKSPGKSYFYSFDSVETSELLFDLIAEDSVDSFGKLFWRLKREGKLMEVSYASRN